MSKRSTAYEFNTGRSSVMGKGGMVAASQPLAVSTGLKILDRGGNAADAAVATAAALNVTEPTSTGIGGDCFVLYYDSNSRAVSALNGSGRSPSRLTLEALSRAGIEKELPAFHPYTITVPGACAGWCDLIERHGSMSLADILSPAVLLAEEGFPVAPITSYYWQRAAERQLKTALNGSEMTINGRGPQPGEIFRNPGLARTFRSIAEKGRSVFYEGEIAQAIAETVAQAGGCLAVDDLAAHVSTWDEPIAIDYKDLRVWECPPNGQGITALLALNILEGFSLQEYSPLSAERLHLEIEALRLAFADTRWYVADPAVVAVPVDELLAQDYAVQRGKLIDPQRATLDQKRGTPIGYSDTVYFCVVDKHGNACSFVNSNYMGFGTGIVPSGWGFTLQNRGLNFSLQPGHPNLLAPAKRPYHTIIPALVTRQDGTLYGPFGVMGGFMQPQGHVQIFLALVEGGLSPQAALDLPRFCIMDGLSGGKVAVEEGMPGEVVEDLRMRGHQVVQVSGWERALFGRGQVIQYEPLTGILTAGSDLRADGCAMMI